MYTFQTPDSGSPEKLSEPTIHSSYYFVWKKKCWMSFWEFIVFYLFFRCIFFIYFDLYRFIIKNALIQRQYLGLYMYMYVMKLLKFTSSWLPLISGRLWTRDKVELWSAKSHWIRNGRLIYIVYTSVCTCLSISLSQFFSFSLIYFLFHSYQYHICFFLSHRQIKKLNFIYRLAFLIALFISFYIFLCRMLDQILSNSHSTNSHNFSDELILVIILFFMFWYSSW